MAHTELDLPVRRRIEDMLNARMSVARIAAAIGRHRATVYREIKRNIFRDAGHRELALLKVLKHRRTHFNSDKH